MTDGPLASSQAAHYGGGANYTHEHIPAPEHRARLYEFDDCDGGVILSPTDDIKEWFLRGDAVSLSEWR